MILVVVAATSNLGGGERWRILANGSQGNYGDNFEAEDVFDGVDDKNGLSIKDKERRDDTAWLLGYFCFTTMTDTSVFASSYCICSSVYRESLVWHGDTIN